MVIAIINIFLNKFEVKTFLMESKFSSF